MALKSQGPAGWSRARRWGLLAGFLGLVLLLLEALILGAYLAGLLDEFRWWQPLIYLPMWAALWKFTSWQERRMKRAHRVNCKIRDLTPRDEHRRWLKGQGVLASGRLIFIHGPTGNSVVDLTEVLHRVVVDVDSVIEPDPTLRRGIRWMFKPVILQLAGSRASYEMQVSVGDVERVKAELSS